MWTIQEYSSSFVIQWIDKVSIEFVEIVRHGINEHEWANEFILAKIVLEAVENLYPTGIG